MSTNPPEIVPGILTDDILAAVEKSGFPMQTRIAAKLAPSFDFIQEEWAYVDADSQETRTLDILISKNYWAPVSPNNLHVRPQLSLLIECKRSDSPFVFFLSSNNPRATEFPLICGLKKETIEITSNALGSYDATLVECLGIGKHSFCANDIPCAMSFSQLKGGGKKIELNGDEPFRKIILPMLKGLQYFRQKVTPPSTFTHFDFHLTFGLVVIDAPLLGVSISGGKNDIKSLDWVRVVRNTSLEGRHYFDKYKSFAIDIVQEKFLDEYLKLLFKFMGDISPVIIKHEQEIGSGKGALAPDYKFGVSNMETFLRPI